MNKSMKLIALVVIVAIFSGAGVYFWQNNEVPSEEVEVVAEEAAECDEVDLSEYVGAAQYNCELSGGTFKDDYCSCPSQEEMEEINEYNCENTDTCLTAEEVRENAYDSEKGYCQTTHGGPGGDAFSASIGLPYGDYSFYGAIVRYNCEESGGEFFYGCMCPDGTTYSKSTGYCE